jgi:glutathione S-transferase
LEGALLHQPYLTGETMTVADLYLVPILYYLGMTKEGQAVWPDYPQLAVWQARMAQRPSVQDTVPPPFEMLRAA